jgi:hypothetical protein
MVACETDERTFTTGPTQAHPDRPVETHVEPKASAERAQDRSAAVKAAGKLYRAVAP